MAKKGVSLVFEQVMLFVVGVTIFLTCFSLFKSYEVYHTGNIMQDQMNEVSDMVGSTIFSISWNQDYNSTLKRSVPERVGNEYYSIRLTQSGINLTSHQTGKMLFRPLASINDSYTLSGGFSTLHGTEFLIYKKGNQIIIG